MIRDVSLVNLKTIPDERGYVKHLIKSDELDVFGEVYISSCRRGVVKAWHGYPTKKLYYAVVKGMVKLVLRDSRKDSETFGQVNEFFLGDQNYCRINIPPGVFNGFKGLEDENIIVVVASEPFSEEGIIRFPKDYFEYDW